MNIEQSIDSIRLVVTTTAFPLGSPFMDDNDPDNEFRSSVYSAAGAALFIESSLRQGYGIRRIERV